MSTTPFDLTGHVFVVTGGAGLLGGEHRAALRAAGATAVCLDQRLPADGGPAVIADVTDRASLVNALDYVLAQHHRLDGVVVNAARNPVVSASGAGEWSRFEGFPEPDWDADLAVGLTGAMLTCQVFGGYLAAAGRGVVVTICSDLSVIAPDQRLYREDGVADDQQPVKPVSYSVVKHGLLGLTRWLSTYWADRGVRVNALSPGGVRTDQPDDFVTRLSSRVPLGRMAQPDEYHGALVFLCSEASSYLTGHNLVVDGGRSVW